jgi:hypothetical protein
MRGEQDFTLFQYRFKGCIALSAGSRLHAETTGLNLAVNHLERHGQPISMSLAQRNPLGCVSVQAVVNVDGSDSGRGSSLSIRNQRIQQRHTVCTARESHPPTR